MAVNLEQSNFTFALYGSPSSADPGRQIRTRVEGGGGKTACLSSQESGSWNKVV